MLRIEHLTKKYSDKTAVDDLNLHIQQGEIYGFIGHNGAGKTTTLSLLWEFCSLTKQDGTVLLLVTIMLCGLTSMDIMTAPSISLEGKSLWIAQSLPVTPWQVLRAKLDMQLILNGIPVMLCMICTAVVCPIKIGQFVMMILQVLSFVFVMAVFGLFMGVIKQCLPGPMSLHRSSRVLL